MLVKVLTIGWVGTHFVTAFFTSFRLVPWGRAFEAGITTLEVMSTTLSK